MLNQLEAKACDARVYTALCRVTALFCSNTMYTYK